MPHISKKALSKDILDELNRLFVSLMRNTGSRARITMFQSILTKTERTMIAKRLGIFLLLEKGMSFHEIERLLGVSPSTVMRFALMKDRGEYRKLIVWIRKEAGFADIDELIGKLVSLIFTGRTKSFGRFVNDM